MNSMNKIIVFSIFRKFISGQKDGWKTWMHKIDKAMRGIMTDLG